MFVVPQGTWVGTYAIGERSAFFRVDFTASLIGDQESVRGVARALRSDLVDIVADGSNISFGLPEDLGILTFNGAIEGDVIAGIVSDANTQGSFHLRQQIHMDPADFAPYIGSYRLDPDRTLLFTNTLSGQAGYHYFEDDRLVAIFPVSETEFVSELGEVFQFDLASVDAAIHVELPNGERHVGRRNDAYSEEQVSFANGKVKLAGSLLIPYGDGPFPVVVFVHGSQGDDRQPYRHYADHFARNGIAALIYDKRGTGSSTGNWRRSGLDPLTGDALAAVEFLKGHPQIDPHSIGIWGLSQGGWIIALAAKEDPEIAFVIGVSAAGTSPGNQEAYRVRNVLEDAGMQGFRLDAAVLWHRVLYVLGHVATKPYFPLPGSIKDMAGGLAVSPFFNPIPVWQQVRQPVLLIYGESDWIVDPYESPELISAALDHGGNSEYTILLFESADHVIRLTQTGRPSEILREIRFAPGYLQATSDWVWSQVNGGDRTR